jgi:hypothetical protein
LKRHPFIIVTEVSEQFRDIGWLPPVEGFAECLSITSLDELADLGLQ